MPPGAVRPTYGYQFATHGWLNARLFLGEGRFPAPATIEYRIFEVG